MEMYKLIFELVGGWYLVGGGLVSGAILYMILAPLSNK